MSPSLAQSGAQDKTIWLWGSKVKSHHMNIASHFNLVFKANFDTACRLEGTACFVSLPKSKLKMGMGSDRALKWPFLASIWLIWLSCKSWRARVLAPEPLCSSGTLIKSWPMSCKPFHFEHKSLETTWAKTRPEWGITRESWKKNQINHLCLAKWEHFLLLLNSQYFWMWTNANPMKISSRAATASKL